MLLPSVLAGVGWQAEDLVAETAERGDRKCLGEDKGWSGVSV